MFARSLFALGAAVLLAAAPAGAAPTAGTAASARVVAPLKRLQALRMAEEPMRERLEARERAERHGLLRRLARSLRRSGRDELRANGENARHELPDEDARGHGAAAPAVAARPPARSNAAALSQGNTRCNSPSGDLSNDGQCETAIGRWNDFMLAAWNDGKGFHDGTHQIQGWATSIDGGATWTDQGTLPSPAGYTTWVWASDPVIAVNPTTGAFYFSALGAPNASQNAVGAIKGRFAANGVFTWETPSVVRTVSTASKSLDKEWIAVEPTTGRTYISYTDFVNTSGNYLSQIEFQWADSALAAWSTAQVLSPSTENGYVQGSRPAAGPGGNVYVMYYLIGPVDADYLRVCRSTNSGVSFLTPVDAVSFYTNYGTGGPGFNRDHGVEFASIAVDRSGGAHDGRVYLAWPESFNWYDDANNLGSGTNKSEVEPDDSLATATPFTPGQTLRGTIASNSDLDAWSVHLTAGQGLLVQCDSISTAFYDDGYGDYAMILRMLAPDGRTRLSYTTVAAEHTSSTPGSSYGPTWLFVAPVDGTYIVRCATPTGTGPAGGYRLRTTLASRTTERGRDQRDVFTSTYDPGGSWSTPVRVSNSPVGYDDWLPEVAVDPNGVAYCAWYDWRDAAAGTTGGESSTYLAISGDGGASWSEKGAVSDARTPWTWVISNIQPNEGDYLSLYASAGGVSVAWSDGRAGNPDVYMQWVPSGDPVALAAQVSGDHVDLSWFVDQSPGFTATLYRRVGTLGAWNSLVTLTSDAARTLHYTDTDVVLGGTYQYRLGVVQNTVESFYGLVTVTIPNTLELALAGAWPNPATSDATIAFTLSSSQRATLQLLDLNGRQVQVREVGGLGIGRHQLPVSSGGTLRPGMYFVRLQQGGTTRSKRVVVL